MSVYLQDSDFTLYNGDALEVLRTLPDESVHCVVTSPPYWGLRDYGTGAWEGGEAECDHQRPGTNGPKDSTSTLESRASNQNHEREPWPNECGKCGAHRIDNQLGLEATPEQYVSNMVEVFREVRRVMRCDATAWINMGDSFAEKQLQMIPARLALALQADGWYLRSQIVWSKPNPMPESVTDRPTTSHEFVYLLAKSPRYFFDQEAVREGVTGNAHARGNGVNPKSLQNAPGQGVKQNADFSGSVNELVSSRNLRSVWNIATQPYPEAHFATYPEELVRRCILAGTSERGCCPECGGPWVRETSVDYTASKRGRVGVQRDRNEPVGRTDGTGWTDQPRLDKHTITTGWHPSCEPHSCEKAAGFEGAPNRLVPIPCTVLDPFSGSGTTALVARKHGRKCIGIELSADYCALSARRLQQLSLLAETP